MCEIGQVDFAALGCADLDEWCAKTEEGQDACRNAQSMVDRELISPEQVVAWAMGAAKAVVYLQPARQRQQEAKGSVRAELGYVADSDTE